MHAAIFSAKHLPVKEHTGPIMSGQNRNVVNGSEHLPADLRVRNRP